jgi:CBS domain containing-hemolysin-like protein
VSEEELLAVAALAVEEDVIEAEERELIESLLEFGDTIVREVMVPRPDMIVVSSDFRVSDVIEVAILNGFSRLPVTGQSIDHIVGVGYLKDLVRLERDGHGGDPVAQHARPARFVPETKSVSELLREMRAERVHLAVVVDEHGGTAGLITLEDLIEEIVGEISDEFDVETPGVEQLPGGGLRVPGRTPIDEVSEALGHELPDTQWDTVAGLVFNLLGHVPETGETVRFQGLEFRAERVQGRRIRTVRITPKESEPAESAAT